MEARKYANIHATLNEWMVDEGSLSREQEKK
jgi:hypothetical protein